MRRSIGKVVLGSVVPFHVSLLRAHGLRMAVDCGGPRRRRHPRGYFWRNPGRIASRADRWIHFGDDPQRWTKDLAGVCWDEDALEHETHVRGIGVGHSGLYAACLVRSCRLPRVCRLGLVGFADFPRCANWQDLPCTPSIFPGHLFSSLPIRRNRP